MENDNKDKIDNHQVQQEWLHKDLFPRTSSYDLEWVLANEMGPNALWFLELLTKSMDLKPGMRVLDMGCGRALTSIFLAKEFGVQVWANDLWVPAEDNWQRINQAGVQDRVFPFRAEAHALPYCADFFDAVVSIDAYQYFGTDTTYLGYITRFLKNGGQLGLIMPGLTQELGLTPPEHLTRPQSAGNVFWESDCWTFHTAEWWKRHFLRAGCVELEIAGNVGDGCQLWQDWERIRNGGGFSGFPSDLEALEADDGRYIGFVQMVARKRELPKQSFDHSMLIRLESL